LVRGEKFSDKKIAPGKGKERAAAGGKEEEEEDV
jgi:hypothetical protein